MLSTPDLELLIARAHSEGRAHFGDLGLDLASFRERIQSIVRKHLGTSPSQQEAIAFVKALHGRDLYLATACAQQSPSLSGNDWHDVSGQNACRAWKVLATTYKGFIHEVARLFFRQSFVAQDLADNIVADLFLPDRSGTSRIVSYDGRSSLCTWLRVVLYNRAINSRRRIYAQSEEIGVNVPDAPALARLDQSMRARRYGKPLEDSLQLACRGLRPSDRLLLLWRYEDGLQLGQIAGLLGIHQSNVTRRLERMQNWLRTEVIRVLANKYGMSGPAIQECMRDGVENPRHTVSILDLVRTSSLEQSAPALQVARSLEQNNPALPVAPSRAPRRFPASRHRDVS
jgi:RNA polymerase sigma factor (sigma-70 family)